MGALRVLWGRRRFGPLAGPGVRRRRQGRGPVSEVRRASGRCAGRGPGQEPDYARRPLSAGTPALRGQARPTRNPRAVTDPHPAHTPDTHGACHKVHEALISGPRPETAGLVRVYFRIDLYKYILIAWRSARLRCAWRSGAAPHP